MKKVLSLLLALCLVVGMVPLAASAVSPELPEAVDGVITLTEDVELSAPVVINENTTINGNGFKISVADGASIGESYLISCENATVDFNSVTIDAENQGKGCMQYYQAQGTLTNVVLRNLNKTRLFADLNINASVVTVKGTFTMEGTGYVDVGWGKSIAESYTNAAFYAQDASTIGVNYVMVTPSDDSNRKTEATFPADENFQRANGYYSRIVAQIGSNGYPSLQAAVDDASEDDTITLVDDFTLTAPITLETGDTITINGNGKTITFAGVDPCKTVFTAPAGSEVEGIPTDVTLNVNNVNFVGQGTNAGYAAIIGGNSYNTNVAFANCGFKNLYCGVYVNQQTTASAGEEYPTLTIQNCNYENTAYGYSADEVTPGVVIGGVEVKFNNNGTITEKESFENITLTSNGTETVYSTFEDALQAAQNGDTITLNKDVEVSSAISINKKDITIDGGEDKHEITYNGSGIDTGAFITVESGTTGITLKNLTVNAKNAKHGVQFYCANNGSMENVTVNGGYWTSVQVNGSENIAIRNCTLTPKANDGQNPYAYIEYSMGKDVNTIPSITVENNTFTSVDGSTNQPAQIWVDDDTVKAIKSNETSLGEEPTPEEITAFIKKQITNAGESSVAIWILFDRTESDLGNVTVDGKPQPEQPTPPVTPTTPTYTNTVSDTDNGKVTVSPTSPKKDDTVTITTTPNEGYKVGSVAVTDADGKTVTVTNAGGGKYTFTQPGSKVTIKVTFVWDNPFTDVKSTAWYYNAVKYVYENNLMAGTGDTTFDPEMNLTRAMTAQILYNLEGKPAVTEEATFTDMNVAPTWSVDAIAWAQDTGVVAGVGNDKFDPNANVTREQFAQMMYNYAKYKEYDLTKAGDLSKFPDEANISTWAETALSWANGNGLINGHDDGTLDPQGNTIRGQAASILMNFDLNVAK